MAKEDITELVELISNSQPEESAIEEAILLVLRDLAERPVRTKAEIVDLEAGQATFQLPSQTTMLMEAVYDFYHLDRLDSRELDSAVGTAWRAAVGSPVAFTSSQESARTFRLYPRPDKATQLTVGPTFFWELIGNEYRTGSLLLFVSEYRDLPPSLSAWLDLYLALRVIQILFTRDSDEQDIELAGVCGKLARAMEEGLEIL